MYQRGGSRFNIFTLLILGVFVGVGYLVYDNWSASETVAPAQAPTPTAVATESAAPLATIQPTQQAREITFGARIIAPTAGINAEVIESYLSGQSWDVSDLGIYAGHLQGTSWVDRPGNVVLAGHVEMSDGRTGVFANINELAIGDPIILRQDGVEHVYNVTEMLTVEPDDLSVLYPTSTSRLTLITCSDYSFLEDIYQQRFVIIAERSA